MIVLYYVAVVYAGDDHAVQFRYQQLKIVHGNKSAQAQQQQWRIFDVVSVDMFAENHTLYLNTNITTYCATLPVILQTICRQKQGKFPTERHVPSKATLKYHKRRQVAVGQAPSSIWLFGRT